jgi:hypothetical protein
MNALIDTLWQRRGSLAALVLALTTSLAGCGPDIPSEAEFRYDETVQLAAGDTVRIRRHVKFLQPGIGGGMKELRAKAFKFSTLQILPESPEVPVWSAPLVPIVLDRDPENGEWVLIASTDNCDVAWDNGNPVPMYWGFRLRAGEWFRAPIPEVFFNRTANLFADFRVYESEAELLANFTQRKAEQIPALPRIASTLNHHFRRVSRVLQQNCGGPSRAIGDNERDLKQFRSL